MPPLSLRSLPLLRVAMACEDPRSWARCTRSLALADELDVDAEAHKRRDPIKYFFEKRKELKRVAPSANEEDSPPELMARSP
jgi:hypothetical protein